MIKRALECLAAPLRLIGIDFPRYVDEALRLLGIVRWWLWFTGHASMVANGGKIASLSVETRRAIEGMLHWAARQARFGAWSCAAVPEDGYGSLWEIAVSGSESLVGKVEKPFAVRGFPARRTEATELVRINFDLVDYMSRLPEFQFILAMELEPFIIGVGQIRTRKTTNGLIILRG